MDVPWHPEKSWLVKRRFNMTDSYTLMKNLDKPILWFELISLYGNDYFHTPKNKTIFEMSEFLEDYFNLCESDGFSDHYWNLNSRYYGNSFEVINRYYGLDYPAWIIKFENGAKKIAYAEEIIPHEMIACGCPWFST